MIVNRPLYLRVGDYVTARYGWRQFEEDVKLEVCFLQAPNQIRVVVCDDRDSWVKVEVNDPCGQLLCITKMKKDWIKKCKCPVIEFA